MLQKENFDLIDGDYTYLTKMPMDSVTAEMVEKIMREKGNKEAELETLKNKNEFDMWNEELSSLEVEYRRFREERMVSMAEEIEESVAKVDEGKKKKRATGGGGGGGGGAEVKAVRNKKIPINSSK
jgi:DNA topoisomerase-2